MDVAGSFASKFFLFNCVMQTIFMFYTITIEKMGKSIFVMF